MLKTARSVPPTFLDCPARCGAAVFVAEIEPLTQGTKVVRRYRLLDATEVTTGERWALAPGGVYCPKTRSVDGDGPGHRLHWPRCSRLTLQERELAVRWVVSE
jgi:hypothetical protein